MGAPFSWVHPSLGGGDPSTLARRTPVQLQPRRRKRIGRAAIGEMKWHFFEFVIGFVFLVECLNLTI